MHITILCGPTASGKSQGALKLAQEKPSVIINADAMQLYSELRIITARPSEAEEAQAPHRLYGVIPAAESSSAGRWLALVKPAIEEAWRAEKQPILVGGTGLYLKALMEGLSPIPDIPAEIQRRIRALTAAPEALHPLLAARDPAMAARLKPGDTQRILRALEVLEETGKSLLYWQAQPRIPIFPEAEFTVIRTDTILREELYRRCDARFIQMLEEGALEEARAVMALNLPSDLPAMRAVGLPELLGYLRGEWPLEQAVAKAQQATRNYAKRQLTWLRNQMG